MAPAGAVVSKHSISISRISDQQIRSRHERAGAFYVVANCGYPISARLR